jgi:hypothetical protein
MKSLPQPGQQRSPASFSAGAKLAPANVVLQL